MARRPLVGIAVLCEDAHRGPDGSLTIKGAVEQLVVLCGEALDECRPPIPRRFVLRIYNEDPKPGDERTVAVSFATPGTGRRTYAQLVSFEQAVITLMFDVTVDVEIGRPLTIDVAIARELATQLIFPVYLEAWEEPCEESACEWTLSSSAQEARPAETPVQRRRQGEIR